MSEVGIKSTEFEKLPEMWEIKLFREIIETVKGNQPSDLFEYKDDEKWLPYLSAEFLRGNIEKTKYCEPERERKITIVKNDDILLIWDGSNAGEFLVGKDGVLSSTMVKLLFKSEQISKEFAYYFLKSCESILKNTTRGSTIPHIDGNILSKLNVLLPTIPEQQKIAEILTTADRKIELIDKEILATEKLKRGLMQTLLTRGIGHSKLKMSEIGEIPEEWAILELDEALEICQYGLSTPMTELGQYPIIKMDDISEGYIKKVVNKKVDLKHSIFEEFKLMKEDILFNRTNSYDRVGRCGIFLLEGDYVFASYLIRLRVNPKVFDPYFLFFYMNFSRDRLLQMATKAVHQANINATNLKTFIVPRPDLIEQRRISNVLLILDEKLERLSTKRALVVKLKEGLMQILLTGKIRVGNVEKRGDH